MNGDVNASLLIKGDLYQIGLHMNELLTKQPDRDVIYRYEMIGGHTMEKDKAVFNVSDSRSMLIKVNNK